MYNNEIYDALEDTYNDGYNQAMLDMDDSYIDEDMEYDEAYEDVDMFDDNYFEAMEGPAREYRHKQNEGKSREQIRKERRDALPNVDGHRDRVLYDRKASDLGHSYRRQNNYHPEGHSKFGTNKSERDNMLRYNRGHDIGKRSSSDKISDSIRNRKNQEFSKQLFQGLNLDSIKI